MPKGQEVLKKLRSDEQYAHERQSGSHVVVKSKSGGTVVVPVHNKDLPPGTYSSIKRQARAAGFTILLLFVCLCVVGLLLILLL